MLRRRRRQKAASIGTDSGGRNEFVVASLTSTWSIFRSSRSAAAKRAMLASSVASSSATSRRPAPPAPPLAPEGCCSSSGASCSRARASLRAVATTVLPRCSSFSTRPRPMPLVGCVCACVGDEWVMSVSLKGGGGASSVVAAASRGASACGAPNGVVRAVLPCSCRHRTRAHLLPPVTTQVLPVIMVYRYVWGLALAAVSKGKRSDNGTLILTFQAWLVATNVQNRQKQCT